MERLVTKRLFWHTPVSGTAVSGPQSSAIDLRIGVLRLEALTFIARSVGSTADIRAFFRVGADGGSWGSYADQTALLTSTFSLANPEGYKALSLPLALAPFIQFAFSGTGSNPQDTVVTADLILRMAQ